MRTTIILVSLSIALGCGKKETKPTPAAQEPGTVLWTFKTGGIVHRAPAIGSDGTVYIGSSNAKVHALDGESGVKKWEFKAGFWVRSSPAIGPDGTVYIGSADKKLYAINGKSGEKKWEFKTGDEVFSSPAIGSDGTVYVGSADNKLYALRGKLETPPPSRTSYACCWISSAALILPDASACRLS